MMTTGICVKLDSENINYLHEEADKNLKKINFIKCCSDKFKSEGIDIDINIDIKMSNSYIWIEVPANNKDTYDKSIDVAIKLTKKHSVSMAHCEEAYPYTVFELEKLDTQIIILLNRLDFEPILC